VRSKVSFTSCASRHIFFGQIFEKMDTRKKNGREVIFCGLFLIFEKANKNKNGDSEDFDQNFRKIFKKKIQNFFLDFFFKK
jgi:hypothetical protein